VRPLPTGFRVVLDPATRVDGTLVWGGTPWRLLRLTPAGAGSLSSLAAGDPVSNVREGVLARRMVDAGLAHPRPSGALSPNDLDVVVPVHDDAGHLAACLAALTGLAVTVVDDGSTDGLAVAAVASRHGAHVIRRARGGPAAARNTGLAATHRPLVAFVDSDCVIDPADLLTVAGHLADPCVAAAAPRITESTGASPLDLGPDESPVHPGARVSFVPTTALVVRRTAVSDVGGFDESMRYGEDVDLMWRLAAAGWAVRYDPSVVAHHATPSVASRLVRKYHYGTSAGPLANRHGSAMSGPTLAGFVAPMRIGTLRTAGLPTSEAVRITAAAPLRTASALMKWSVPRTAGDVAYHLGVWHGCLNARTLKPLLPRLRGAEGR
jgi:mycofactocin system glycosyltransferase